MRKIPEAEYRALPDVSQSSLKRLLEVSPQQWQYEQIVGTDETPAMMTGTMAHEIALEGTKSFLNRYAIDDWPQREKGNRRGNSKAYQEFKKELQESGKPLVKYEDVLHSERLAEAIHREWSPILAVEGTPEISVDNQILHRTVKSKGLIDFYPKDLPLIVDLKTTATPLDDRAMRKKLIYEGWGFQAAYYRDLVYADTGEERLFVFLVINTQNFQTRKIVVPHDCELIEFFREEYRRAIDIYADCLKENKWPGYSNFEADKLILPNRSE